LRVSFPLFWGFLAFWSFLFFCCFVVVFVCFVCFCCCSRLAPGWLLDFGPAPGSLPAGYQVLGF
jgi:hypothetical protein